MYLEGQIMSNKNKIEFFQKVAEMQEMNMIEDQLKEQPIFEDELSKLGYDLISKNNDTIKDLRDRGLIVRRPYPTLEEFVDQAGGFVVKRSTVFQMEKEEYSQVRRTGLFNKGIEIYNDMEDNQVPLHFDWQHKELNGTYTTSFTGGSNMLEVTREVLDVQESEARASDIRAVQSSYKQARQEIDWLLNNLEALQQGSINTQYHGSVSR